MVPKYGRKYCDLCWKIFCMSLRTTPRRVDANQPEIVEALRGIGCSVIDLSAIGKGCPDLLVYSPSTQKVLLFEVKNPKAKGKLNKLQQKWIDTWQGQVAVVWTVEEAISVALNPETSGRWPVVAS